MTIESKLLLAHADAAVDNASRFQEHVTVELTNVIDDIMDTVTPENSLSWCETWSWAQPDARPDGMVKLRVKTNWDDIRNLYAANRGRYQCRYFGKPRLRLAGGWYAIGESFAKFESLPDRIPFEQTWVAFAPTDGTEGITGEIVWSDFPQLAPGKEITGEDRVETYAAYLAALNARDIDALLALMSEGVQGAVRDYVGPESFVHLDGTSDMRRYYERLFSSARIESVDPVQFVDRGWYLFTELRWQIAFTDGPRARRNGTILTGEILPLDKQGKIYARLGYGTEILS